MGLRIEWRSRAEGDDSLLTVDEQSDTVVEAWPADTLLLTDFLNEMTTFEKRPEQNGVRGAQRDPDEWGALVIARSDAGDVLDVDPQLYWEGVAFWFRSRGEDPHPWRGRK